MASRRSELRAGTTRIDITPPVGYRLVGHESRVTPSQGVHDPLSAKVLTLSSGQTRLAIVSAEILYFTPEIVRTYPWLSGSPEVVNRWAAHWRGVLRRGGRRPTSLPVDVQALRIGEAILVCLPGEPMVEVGLELKDCLPGRKMVIGYLGGRAGPIPSPRDVRENVPETHYFLHYLYPAPFAGGAQASLVRAALNAAQGTES